MSFDIYDGLSDAAKELALGLVEQGEYAEALAVALDAVTVARDANYPPLLILTLMILGAIHRRLGAFETARSLHREALALDELRTVLAFSEQLLAELLVRARALHLIEHVLVVFLYRFNNAS